MYVILGAAGHIASAVAADLLRRGEPILAITRTAEQAASWQAKGAHATAIDVLDTTALRDTIGSGSRLFLLNPPAKPSSDTDVEERRTLASILMAVDGAGLKKIVAASTYGARRGQHVGDLRVARALKRNVEAVQTLRGQWPATMHAMGFSDESARSFAAMTDIVLEQRYEAPAEPMRGPTTLQNSIEDLVRAWPD